MMTGGMNSHQGSLMWGAPQWYNNIVIGDFDSNSICTDIGSMNDHYGAGFAGLSDGTDHYACGGGNGSENQSTAGSGPANSGGGGGGSWNYSSSPYGSGGSGMVLVRYSV